MSEKPRIGIIGAGMVGGAMAKALARRGYPVVVASTDPKSEKMQRLVAAAGPNASAGTAAEAASGGEIIVLATPWTATEDILRGLDGLGGKIILDATNPIAADFSGLERGFDTSGGETVAAAAPGARVVKAMNQIGFELMDGPTTPAGRPLMFIAGDDDDAKTRVAALVEDLGFEADDCGPLKMARYLEPLAWLWINRAMIQGKGRHFALVMMDAKPGGV